MHPALGDSGGVHAAALHLLELRGALTCALARLLAPALFFLWRACCAGGGAACSLVRAACCVLTC